MIPAHAALRAFHGMEPAALIKVERGQHLGAGAIFSPCECWRYLLWRVWDEALPLWSFGMLNPSTADHLELDPTVSRCVARAQQGTPTLGRAGGIVVWNLFAWRDTDPKAMKRASDPIGPANDAAIRIAVDNSSVNIAAWGAHGSHRERDLDVRTMLGEAGIALHALHFTDRGQPRHPLYLRNSLEPRPWSYWT